MIDPETGRGTAREARGGGGYPPKQRCFDEAWPLHHPADGPPPRFGEDY